MRIVFSVFILLLSVFFLIYGLKYDYVNSSGQVGAGFFPIWIGSLLVFFSSISLFKDIKHHLKERPKIQITDNISTLLIILGLTVLFIASLNLLGAVVAMIIYIFVVLYVLNRGRIIFNTVLSLIVSLGCYLLLDVWLNAGLPKGIFGI